MKIIKLSKRNLTEVLIKAVQTLENGGLVVYPTETCYGLGADATNQAAINKLLSYKRRREGKPLSILVDSEKVASKYVYINESAHKLYQRFLPGPMTIVSKAKEELAEGVASELGNIGVRISSHPFAMDLVRKYRRPITATSANASWQKKPYSIDDILSPLSECQKVKLDLLIDAGQLPKREASTVVDTTLVDTMVLRRGSIDLGEKQVELLSHSEDETKKMAHTLILKHWNDIREKGLVVGLIGELGVGKTIFVKGIGEFLRVETTIVSPSYTLVNEYPYERHSVKGILYHLDPWRLEKFEDLSKLGFSTMLRKNNVVAVEWASKYLEEIEAYCRKTGVQFIKVRLEDLGSTKRNIIVYV
ncbi:MAG: L-threonylcarbamoyladenylate synthase [Patescibacteria group bacterium]